MCIKIYYFSLTKMHFKIASAKWQPHCAECISNFISVVWQTFKHSDKYAGKFGMWSPVNYVESSSGMQQLYGTLSISRENGNFLPYNSSPLGLDMDDFSSFEANSFWPNNIPIYDKMVYLLPWSIQCDLIITRSNITWYSLCHYSRQ